MYYSGEGVGQDYNVALEWYQKAAEQGDATAEANIGLMYQEGQGVAQNYAGAADWLLKAAKQGLSYAQNRLAIIYESGLRPCRKISARHTCGLV